MGVIRHPGIQRVCHFEFSRQFFQTLPAFFETDLIDIRHKVCIFPSGQPKQQVGRIRHESEGALRLQRLCLDVLSIQRDRPRIGLEHPGDHADEGGFARSVGSDEPRDFARLHMGSKIRHSGFVTVGLCSILNIDHGSQSILSVGIHQESGISMSHL